MPPRNKEACGYVNRAFFSKFAELGSATICGLFYRSGRLLLSRSTFILCCQFRSLITGVLSQTQLLGDRGSLLRVAGCREWMIRREASGLGLTPARRGGT
jgi:hypothetical protein